MLRVQEIYALENAVFFEGGWGVGIPTRISCLILERKVCVCVCGEGQLLILCPGKQVTLQPHFTLDLRAHQTKIPGSTHFGRGWVGRGGGGCVAMGNLCFGKCGILHTIISRICNTESSKAPEINCSYI